MPNEPTTYLTPPEAAEYLRISTSTLAKLRVYGGGPAFTRIGRAIRYTRTELDAFMAAQSRPLDIRAINCISKNVIHGR